MSVLLGKYNVGARFVRFANERKGVIKPQQRMVQGSIMVEIIGLKGP